MVFVAPILSFGLVFDNPSTRFGGRNDAASPLVEFVTMVEALLSRRVSRFPVIDLGSFIFLSVGLSSMVQFTLVFLFFVCGFNSSGLSWALFFCTNLVTVWLKVSTVSEGRPDVQETGMIIVVEGIGRGAARTNRSSLLLLLFLLLSSFSFVLPPLVWVLCRFRRFVLCSLLLLNSDP